MANLKEIRTRINSVKSTRQITSAMKLVAASKLRKAQNAIIALRPYSYKIQEIMGNLSDSLGEHTENPYLRESDVNNILLVSIASNKGLCGPFNANIIKETERRVHQNFNSLYENGGVHLLTLGKKLTEYFGKRDYHLTGNHDEIYDNLTFENSTAIAKELMQGFKEKQYDKIYLVYNKFINPATQQVKFEQFLPLEPLQDETSNTDMQTDYIFEPSKNEIVEELIPKTLKIHFYQALLDSNAAEHGARMTAMHQATDNATELINDLQLKYNKARQESITNQIIEVVSGAKALEG